MSESSVRAIGAVSGIAGPLSLTVYFVAPALTGWIDRAVADALELPIESIDVLRAMFSAEARLQPPAGRVAVGASWKRDVEVLSLFG